VKTVRNGQTVQRVADAYGMNIRTLFRWLAAYASGGQEALPARPIPGRPAKLTGEQMSKVISALRRLQRLKAVVQGFFRHPHCRYSSDAALAV
jgi:transposase